MSEQIDKYAPAAVAEKRVQEMAFTDDALSVKMATEDRAVVTAFNAEAESVFELEKRKEEAGLKEPTELELDTIAREFEVISEDPAKSADEKAAADINRKIAEDEKRKKVELRKRKPTRYRKSFEMFNSVKFSVRPEEGSKEEEKLNRYSYVRKNWTNYLYDRFSTTISFSARMLKAKPDSVKELAAPSEERVEYKDLG